MAEAIIGALSLKLAHRGVPAGAALLAVRPHAVHLAATGPGLAGHIAHAESPLTAKGSRSCAPTDHSGEWRTANKNGALPQTPAGAKPLHLEILKER